MTEKEARPETEARTERIEIKQIHKPSPEILRLVFGKDEQTTCALCFDASGDAVLMECGHGGICFRCGTRLLRMKGSCPLCREAVVLVLRIDIVNRSYGDFAKVVDFVDSSQLVGRTFRGRIIS